MNYPRLLSSIIFFCYLSMACLSAQNNFSPNYTIEQISSNTGITSLEITKLFQDSDGFIWLGTSTGLSRFDGKNFENFPVNGGHLIGEINDIVETENGQLWIASNDGLFYFKDNQLHASSIQNKVVNTIYIDDNKNLIVGGSHFIPFIITQENQAKLIDGQTIESHGLIDRRFWERNHKYSRVWEITQDDKQKYWIGIDHKLAKLKGDTLSEIWRSDNDKARVNVIIAIHNDSLYWTGDGLALRFKNSVHDSLIVPNFTDFGNRTDSTLTFVTTQDIIRIDSTGQRKIADLEGYDHMYLRSMLEDKEGNIWIAAEGILLKVKPNYFQSWNIEETPILASNHSIEQLRSGEILIGSSKKNILAWEENKFQIKHEIPAAYNSVTEGILEDEYGNLLFATSMTGLIIKKSDDYKVYGVEQGLADPELHFIKRDEYDRIWTGGELGVSQLVMDDDEYSVESFTPLQGNRYKLKFIDMHCLSKADCYAISNSGIFKLESNGLEPIEIHHSDKIKFTSSASMNSAKELLLSAPGQGVYKLKMKDGGQFQVIKKWNQSDGLISDVALKTFVDKNDAIWTFYKNGVCVIEENDEGDWIRCYDENDGWQPLASTHVDLLESDDEMMWVVANSTINTFPLYEMPVNKIPPKVFITNVQLFEGRETLDKYVDEGKQLKLPYDKNFLKFKFASTSLTQNDKNRFSYKLDGLEERWSTPSTSHEVSYPGLKPGNYEFNLKAYNNSGIVGEEVVIYSFEISWPWYFQWWAISCYIIGFTGFASILYLLQLNRKRKEDEANKLKDLNEFQSQFFTNVTHEFRTPLTVIFGMIERLKEENEVTNNPSANDTISMIQRNAENLLKLVNEMLDISKLENGSMELHMVQRDVSTFVKYSLESLKSLASVKKIDLVCYVEETNLVMDFDEEKVGAILTNLVSNAIKYSHPGDQIIVHLKSELIEGKRFLMVKVKDEGEGISEQDIDHVFDRFYKAKNTNSLDGEGTGIGLALTKELIQLMSGRITVESQIGVGTEFKFFLPITNNAVKKDQPILPQETVKMQSSAEIIKKEFDPNIDGEIALIIEDNLDVASYLISCLDDRYQTIHAKDGQEGIELALEHQPDIIICDVMMPHKNGFEVCEFLKSETTTDHIPIILLTARVQMKDKLAGISHGADAYLTKPFSKPELFTRIDQLISTRKKLQDKLAKSGIDAFMRKKLVDPDALFVQKAIKFIQDDIDNTAFGPAFLARKLLISESQLYRKLKSITGKSTAVFIRSVRLQKAKELLSQSKLNVSEVAYEVGFSNPSWFSTAFKEEFGYAPSELK